MAHLPDEQTSPALQVAPQAPQFALSLWVLVHKPLQSISPPGQDRAHLPDEQTSPALHAVAQVPQFALSLWVLVQLPLQLVSPL